MEKKEKIARCYRLSKDVIDVIENRDKSLYPNVTDFVEMKILAKTEPEPIAIKLNQISVQLEEIRRLLPEEEKKKEEVQYNRFWKKRT